MLVDFNNIGKEPNYKRPHNTELKNKQTKKSLGQNKDPWKNKSTLKETILIKGTEHV